MNSTGGHIIARGASVIGREHVRLGRNNQDGWSIVSTENACVGVIADGCSSQPFSEVGARLGSRYLAEWISQQIVVTGGATESEQPSGHPESAQRLEGLRQLPQRSMAALVHWIRSVAPSDDIIEKYFLFTIQCCVMTRSKTLMFGLGDGIICADDTVVELDSGPSNAPTYPAYWASSTSVPVPAVHCETAATFCALATDGLNSHAQALRDLSREAAVWKNPAQLQRRLNVMSAQEKLSDDATILMMRLPEFPS